MAKKPKTHSDILWHFTGGPSWDSVKNCQTKSLKADSEAYAVAIAILQSKHLRLGGYHELIKVTLPKYRFYDRVQKKFRDKINYKVELKTSQVCCVADIPESELFHHSKRYGKMAIGFKRAAVLKANFNPVFYTLHHTDIARNFFQAQRGLESLDSFGIESEVDSVMDSIGSNLCGRCEDEVDLDGSSIVYEAENQLDEVNDSLEDLENIMSFVKTFSSKEFNTIYAEREWRSLSQFDFSLSDIHTILFPKKELLDKFTKESTKLGISLGKIRLKVFPKT